VKGGLKKKQWRMRSNTIEEGGGTAITDSVETLCRKTEGELWTSEGKKGNLEEKAVESECSV